MGTRSGSWTDEFVGRRFGFAAIVFVMGAGSWVAAALSHSTQGLFRLWPIVSAAAFVFAVVDALRPNRLRLSSYGFELLRTWGGRRRVAWEDAEPPFFVTFTGKGGRKYDVVRCEYASPRTGRRRTVSMPLDLGMSPLSLLVRMNEARAMARGEAE